LHRERYIDAQTDSDGRPIGPPLDSWGNAIRYEPPASLDADPSDESQWPRVWSPGVDGVDQHGAADDLMAGQGVNRGYYNRVNQPAAERIGFGFGIGLAVAVVFIAATCRRLWTWLYFVPAYVAVAFIVCLPMSDTTFRIPTLRGGTNHLIYNMSCLALAITAIGVAPHVWRRTRRLDRIERGECFACGYSLKGLPSDAARCPECGREREPVAH